MFAQLTTLVNPIETEDCGAVSLEMADGSLCTLALTTGSAHEISRHRFCFQHLSAESHTAPYRSSSDPWKFTGDSPELDARIQETLRRFVPQPDGFAGQFDRFQGRNLDAHMPALAGYRRMLRLYALMRPASGRQWLDVQQIIALANAEKYAG